VIQIFSSFQLERMALIVTGIGSAACLVDELSSLEKTMSLLTTILALRAAINVLRDSAESRKMPSGEP